MITQEMSAAVVRLVGSYLVDHADDLMMIEYSDLEDDEIEIRIKRRGSER